MSDHHRTTAYLKFAKTARAYLRPMLPMPCPRCGRIMTKDMKLDLGHIVPVSAGGTDRLSNVRFEHARCNRRAGGKQAQAQRSTERRKDQRLGEW